VDRRRDPRRLGRTSEWTADEIRAAWDVADRHGWHKPITEQSQYNLLWRERVEKEYARLYEDIGLGNTIWSPLGSGLLTGKYLDGVPEDSRAALEGYEWLGKRLTDGRYNDQLVRFKEVAEGYDATMAQLAIAWTAANPNVSTVITGASRPEQVVENMQALQVLEQLDEAAVEEIAGIFA